MSETAEVKYVTSVEVATWRGKSMEKALQWCKDHCTKAFRAEGEIVSFESLNDALLFKTVFW